MSRLLMMITLASLLGPGLAFAQGNPNPILVLTIHNTEVDQVPEGVCIMESGEWDSWIHCYDIKGAPGDHGFVSVHVGHAPNGFTGLPFGIVESGYSVSFLGFFSCPGFETGPSQAGIPAAIVATSTTGCRRSRESVGYLKYVCADTGPTFFDIVPNADLGHHKAINCEGEYDEGTVVGDGAQWGGVHSLICEELWVGVEPVTWGRIKSLYR